MECRPTADNTAYHSQDVLPAPVAGNHSEMANRDPGRRGVVGHRDKHGDDGSEGFDGWDY